MELGYKPERTKLILSTGADFILDLLPEDSWVDGTVSRIDFLNQAGTVLASWSPAQVTYEAITYIVDSDDADEIPAKTRFRLYISYSDEDPQLDYLRYYGTVTRTD